MGYFSGALVADSDSYSKALQRKRDILSQLEALRGELKAVDEFIALHERIFGQESKQEGSDRREPSTRVRNLLPPERLVELSREILRQTGHPLTRSELAREIERRGIPLAGVDPIKNLGTILWRATGRIQSVPGRGYWLAELPVPPAED